MADPSGAAVPAATAKLLNPDTRVTPAAALRTNSVQPEIPEANWDPNNLASSGQVSYAASESRQFQFGLRLIDQSILPFVESPGLLSVAEGVSI